MCKSCLALGPFLLPYVISWLNFTPGKTGGHLFNRSPLLCHYCNVSVMCQQLAASPLFLGRPTCALGATRRCILVSSFTLPGNGVLRNVSELEGVNLRSGCYSVSPGLYTFVCVFHRSREGDITGQGLASPLSALREVQQDSCCWQPRRGEKNGCFGGRNSEQKSGKTEELRKEVSKRKWGKTSWIWQERTLCIPNLKSLKLAGLLHMIQIWIVKFALKKLI